MDNFVWRFRARMVAYFGLFLTIAIEVYVILATIETLIAISRSTNPKVAVWVALLVILLQNILVGVQCWTALQLLKATKDEIAVDEALKKSRIWLKVNGVVLVVGAVYKVFSIYAAIEAPEAAIWIVAFMIVYAIYLTMMFIVFKFIQEQERVVTSGGNGMTNLVCEL